MSLGENMVKAARIIESGKLDLALRIVELLEEHEKVKIPRRVSKRKKVAPDASNE